MSRKLFNKAKEIAQHLTHKASKPAPLLHNQQNKNCNEPDQLQSTFLAQKINSFSSRLKSLRPRLNPTQYSLNFTNSPQQQRNQPPPQPEKGQYDQIYQRSKQSLQQPKQQKRRDPQTNPNRLQSWFEKGKLSALKSSANEKLAGLQEEVRQKQQSLANLKADAQMALSAKSQQLKRQITDKLTPLREKRDQFSDKASNIFRPFIQQDTETAKEKTKEIKKDKLQYIKAKIRSLEQYLQLHKKQLQDIREQSTGKMSENAQRLKNTVKDKISEAATTKAEIISKLISKLFWRIALLIGVASFAYGIGTSLPRELREHFKFLKRQQKGSKDQEGSNEKQLSANNQSNQ